MSINVALSVNLMHGRRCDANLEGDPAIGTTTIHGVLVRDIVLAVLGDYDARKHQRSVHDRRDLPHVISRPMATTASAHLGAEDANH